jgi:sugar lactone lactonase YvrE
MASWWITFHGDGGISNIQTFSTANGALESSGLLQTGATGEGTLDELRGFSFDLNGNLYVANADGSNSNILCFSPNAGSAELTFTSVFTSEIVHPFDMVYAFSNYLFVSNQSHSGQGGNDVTYYKGFGWANAGTQAGNFGNYDDVRGLAFDGTYLYVADNGANTVTPYDFNLKAQTPIEVTGPDHLYYDRQQYLYIGTEANGIWYWDTTNPSSGLKQFLDPNPAMKALAGFAFGGDGYVYVADRNGNQILRFPVTSLSPPAAGSTGAVFISNSVLNDNPEFIKLIA